MFPGRKTTDIPLSPPEDLRAQRDRLLPEDLALLLQRVGRHHLDRLERVAQLADVADPERQQVLRNEIETRILEPGRPDVLLHDLRLVAVLHEAELVDAVALERLV